MTLNEIWNIEAITKPCVITRLGSTFLLRAKFGEDFYEAELLVTNSAGFSYEGKRILRSDADDWALE